MLRIYNKPLSPGTAAQLAQRQAIKDKVSAWQALSQGEKATWNSDAKALGCPWSGYTLFMSTQLVPICSFFHFIVILNKMSPKIKLPFGSQSAKKSIGKVLTFYDRGGLQKVRLYNKPTGLPSAGQTAQRQAVKEAVELWQALSYGYKAAWNSLAYDLGDPWSGYTLFIKQTLAGYGANKILNGEFEIPGSGAAVFSNWIDAADGASTVNQDNINPYSGDNCCRLDIDADSNNAYVKQAVTLIPNKIYKMSIWAKTFGVNAYVGSHFRDTGGHVGLDPDGTWSSSSWTTWFNAYDPNYTKYKTEFICHPNYANYTLYLIRTRVSTSCSLYLDLAQLRETPAEL